MKKVLQKWLYQSTNKSRTTGKDGSAARTNLDTYMPMQRVPLNRRASAPSAPSLMTLPTTTVAGINLAPNRRTDRDARFIPTSDVAEIVPTDSIYKLLQALAVK